MLAADSICREICTPEEVRPMKMFRILTVLFGLAVLPAYFPLAHADQWDKATKITFSEPVEVPGRVLPPGTYTFKLLNSDSDRHIVQIFNEDQTSLVTTVFAIANERLEPAGKTILTYDERPSGQPMALAAWFYPGSTSGQEFVYPKSEAEMLSHLNKRRVPSMESEEAQNQTPAGEPNPKPSSPPAAANQTPSPSPSPAPKAANTQVAQNEAQLPHTASLLPLIGLIGVSLLGVALVLRLALRS
jgi:phytoene dehydrogenase-like protein